MKKLKKKLNIPLYKGGLVLLQVENLSSIEKKYNLTSTLGFEAVCFVNDEEEGSFNCVIAFEGKPKPEIVAHECLHFVNQLCLKYHITHDVNNDEAQAYLLTWAVEQCHKYLKVKR